MVAALLPPPGAPVMPAPGAPAAPTWAVLAGALVGLLLSCYWFFRARRWRVRRLSLVFWAVLTLCLFAGPLLTAALTRLTTATSRPPTVEVTGDSP